MKELHLNGELFSGSEEEFLAIKEFEWKEWRKNGEYHRTDGPARICSDGHQAWCQNGGLHRTDGPALIYTSGLQEWCQNDLPHRIDGPAKIWPNGKKEWYIEGLEFYEFFNFFFPMRNYAKDKSPGE